MMGIGFARWRGWMAMGMVLAGLLGAGLVGGCQSTATDSQWLDYYENARAEGYKAFEQGRYVDASASFKNALRFYTTDYKMYHFLGASYEQLGKIDQSISSYRTALDVQKVTWKADEDDAFRMKTVDALASLLARSDERGIQRDHLLKLAEGRKNRLDYLVLAKADRLSGDADMAMSMYDKALALAPNDYVVNRDFGLWLAQLGQKARAQGLLRAALDKNKQDTEVADALAKLGG